MFRLRPGHVALLVALAFLAQACQKAIAPSGNSNVANTGGGNANAAQSGQPPAPSKTHLKVGDAAPDFSLTDTNGAPVRLSDFRGKKNVVLAFYVLAFTGG